MVSMLIHPSRASEPSQEACATGKEATSPGSSLLQAIDVMQSKTVARLEEQEEAEGNNRGDVADGPVLIQQGPPAPSKIEWAIPKSSDNFCTRDHPEPCNDFATHVCEVCLKDPEDWQCLNSGLPANWHPEEGESCGKRDSFFGMSYGKGVSLVQCKAACEGGPGNIMGLNNRCQIAKYHAANKWCWLMPTPQKPCTPAQQKADEAAGWTYTKAWKEYQEPLDDRHDATFAQFCEDPALRRYLTYKQCHNCPYGQSGRWNEGVYEDLCSNR